MIWVVVAFGSDEAHFVSVEVEDHVVLPHEGTSEEDLVRTLEFLHCYTILSRFATEEVLARVPMELNEGAVG